jgi:hypothetical protein|eukprot:COSAG01_NODE_3746_length_5742_cov_9.460393_2_plen_127_part_00
MPLICVAPMARCSWLSETVSSRRSRLCAQRVASAVATSPNGTRSRWSCQVVLLAGCVDVVRPQSARTSASELSSACNANAGGVVVDYVHIRPGSALVSVGEIVTAGQALCHSGSVGQAACFRRALR